MAVEDGDPIDADVVIDASGRSSRLPHWLAELGVPVPEPVVVDAHLGYACRLYRASGPPPLDTGIVISATPANGRGGIALPVEDDHWLIIGGGYGEHRPSRDPAEFAAYLADLADPAIADLADRLEPVSDVAVYRQTSNRRHRYGLVRSWPANLLVVGDAACAFNPVYGQGMSVAAQQAVRLRDHWGRPDLQRRLDRVADFPWSVATSEDLRQPTSAGETEPGPAAGHRLEHGAGAAGGGGQRAGGPGPRPGVPPDDRAPGAAGAGPGGGGRGGAGTRARALGAPAGGAGPAPLAAARLAAAAT